MHRKDRTYFRPLLEDHYAYFVAFLPLELLQADGRTQACWAASDDADVNVILCSFDSLGVEWLVEAHC